MDSEFWHQRWKERDIGFHRADANPHLVRYFKELKLAAGSRVVVPLCGKTLDIAWLLGEGYRVAGAELSAVAITELFTELGVTPKITDAGKLKCYSGPGVDIFVGDIFDLSAEILGGVDAVYDRAALVALPPEMRARYAAHLPALTHNAPQLLVTYQYDQSLAAGPPFSVTKEEVAERYGEIYELKMVTSAEVPGGLRGKIPAVEHVWLLMMKNGDSAI
jgi:thiopurine S-methyltransferase